VEPRYLYEIIEGAARSERAIVFVLDAEQPFIRFVGMTSLEVSDYIKQLLAVLDRRKDIREQLERIAGSERKQ
jgi:hypothetical protein